MNPTAPPTSQNAQNPQGLPADAEEMFDLADEDQILAEMSGRVTEKFVYSMKVSGQIVNGLSHAGTNWACREYAKQGEVIRVNGHPSVSLDPTSPKNVLLSVIVQRVSINRETGKEVLLDSCIGAKCQSIYMKKRKFTPDGRPDGDEEIQDPFWFEKGVSKAQRNGKQQLIPQDIVKKLIEKAMQLKGVKEVKPPEKKAPAPASAAAAPQAQAPAAHAPAPAATPEASKPQAPPPEAPKAEKPAPVKPSAPDRSVLFQKLDAVSKQAFGVTDAAVAREKLRQLTGKTPEEMKDEQIKLVGTLLQGVAKKQNIVNERGIVRVSDGVVVLAAKVQPPAAPAPQAPEPLVVPDTEEMF